MRFRIREYSPRSTLVLRWSAEIGHRECVVGAVIGVVENIVVASFVVIVLLEPWCKLVDLGVVAV
ncbi:hypothetical protein C2G38_2235053 [Gigaspora rosea]|uniref:Uncharacterized protein n=1 Tax=Gigaspora rosea TaxID=44941 RepID=A0A397TU78_9GLOM|nr:hypothetical protein C2G38_2235053 [Gigaspora rosea]